MINKLIKILLISFVNIVCISTYAVIPNEIYNTVKEKLTQAQNNIKDITDKNVLEKQQEISQTINLLCKEIPSSLVQNFDKIVQQYQKTVSQIKGTVSEKQAELNKEIELLQKKIKNPLLGLLEHDKFCKVINDILEKMRQEKKPKQFKYLIQQHDKYIDSFVDILKNLKTLGILRDSEFQTNISDMIDGLQQRKNAINIKKLTPETSDLDKIIKGQQDACSV